MRKPLLILLTFSLALNVGFGAATLFRWLGWRSVGRPLWTEGMRRPSGMRPPFTHGNGHRPGHPGGPELGPHWVDRHLEHLDAWVTLTPEQKALLHEALSQSRDEAGRLVQKLRERREELRELLSSVEVDSISIRSTVADISQLQSELDSLLMETLLREQLILRPEQRGAFGRWLARSRAERHMRMHKGDQSPGGDDPSSTKIDPPPGR